MGLDGCFHYLIKNAVVPTREDKFELRIEELGGGAEAPEKSLEI